VTNLDKHNKIREDLVEIDSIPNPPFNTRSIKKYLQWKVGSLGFDLVSNPYYSYIHVTSNPGAQKLVLFSHTDHPAFVFKNKDSGLLLGMQLE